MAFDREDTLKKAEKLLRQGRLDAAIAEYLRVVEDQPRDWNTANTLGDLYVRAGQTDKAAAQYTRIADHFMEEGFYPRAAAIYKKLLKLTPEDERTQLQLAEISVKQGLLADAKTYLNAVVSRRRARGDRGGAADIIVRLGSIDPGDVEARLAAARTVEEMGDTQAAAGRYRELYADLQDRGRGPEALAALREVVRLAPYDTESRGILAKAAVAAGDFEGARAYLDRETAGSDPDLLLALLETDLRAGQLDQAREVLPQVLASQPETIPDRIIALGWSLVASSGEAAFVCVDAVVDLALSRSAFDEAAALLQEFVTRQPNHIPALLKLVEICVDGGLESMMYQAQAELTDAYLASGQAAEARVIAEDLVAREPWEQAHIERFRRALVLLKVPDPDTYIAERLSGQAPFMATDPFADELTPAPTDGVDERSAAAAQPPPPEVPAEEAPSQPMQGVEPAVARSDDPPAPPQVTIQPPTPSGPAAAPPRKPSMEIDLTSALKDLYASQPEAPKPAPPPQPASLDEVFQGYRQEAKRQAAADQSAHHMTLGRTYLELGMQDEAIAALITASRSPRLRFEAASLLGRLYRQRGETGAAVEWFERAAEAPAPTPEEGWALLYELGVMLETAGETARALAVLLELQAEAGDYRDVSARTERLARVQTGG